MLDADDRELSTNSLESGNGSELNSQYILEHQSSSSDGGFRKSDSPRVNAAEYFVVEDASETAEEIVVGEMDTWEEEEGGTFADEEGGGTVADEGLLVSTVDMDFPTAVQEEEVVVEEAVLSTPLDDLSDFEVNIASIKCCGFRKYFFRIRGSVIPNYGSVRPVNYCLRPRILPGFFVAID
jgi:hypothetical protein